MKIKGHTSIILTDVKTGKVKRYEDDNLITNGILKYLVDCGLMNFPSVDQNSLVETLFGGILAFDTALTENANTLHPPGGVKMIANGSVGTLNSSNVTEFGSWSETESGWQADGSYLQVYDFTTAQGNGTIACVCMTSKQSGYIGDGNTTSDEVMSSSLVATDPSTAYAYNPGGYVCGINISGSYCYSVDFSDISNGNIKVRKLSIPTAELNVSATRNSMYVLDEFTLTAPANLKTFITTQNPYVFDYYQDNGNSTMAVMNYPPAYNSVWGTDYTQYLWEIDCANKTVTESTIPNTSGDTLHGIEHSIWIDHNTLAFIDGYGNRNTGNGHYNGVNIYYCTRSNGTWGTMHKVTNPYGYDSAQYPQNAGFDKLAFASGGKARIETSRSANTRDFILDTVAGACYKVNGRLLPTATTDDVVPTSEPMIYARVYTLSGVPWFELHRHNYFLASVNNLSDAVTKDGTKTMKIIYRISFEEEE